MQPSPNRSRRTWTSFALAALLLGPLAGTAAQEPTVRERGEIAPQYRWATESIYPSDEAWETDFAKLDGDIDRLAKFEGTLGDNAKTLLAFLRLRDELGPQLEKVWSYAMLRSDEDTRVGKYLGMKGRMQGVGVKWGQATAWVEPELTGIPWETLEKWMQADQDLALYRQYFDDLFRQKKHILAPREEELIALGGQIFATPYTTYSVLSNSDIQFPTIKDEQGQDTELYDNAFYKFMRSPDRRVRRDAYQGIVGTYAQYRNTAAALLNGAVQSHIFNVRARGYENCLAAALDGGNIPIDVYQNLVDTVNANLPLLHRYQTIRRSALGLTDGVHAYDLFAPFTAEAKLEYTYEQAVDLMKAALQPLGQDYCTTVAHGVASRWIDVFPSRGKRSGAYSAGTYLTQPFILLNFDGGYEDASTLAHEMGHSMHSFLSSKHQPYIYADYDIFCAEVASTANEVLLQDYVLARITDPQQKLYLLGELLEGFRGTVFRQTMFSEFEQRIHEMAEAGEPLTADTLGAAYGEIMRKYYGPDYVHDDVVDSYWIRIPHFYYNFYVYKYATSHCAAANIVSRIRKGEPGALEAYLAFLSSGSSAYPIELLKRARVDMTSPAPIEDAMKYFERLLDETEAILKTSGRLAGK